MSSDPKRRIPDQLVERVLAGEVTDAERQRVMGDPDARERLDDLVRQNASFHVRVDGAAQLRAIDARAKEAAVAEALAPRRGSWWPVWIVGAPLALLALVLMRMPPDLVDPTKDVPKEQTTAKGLKARLRVSQNTPRGLERVSADQVLFKGDEIQVYTVSGDASHGVVVSIDGRGHVTRHFPREGRDTTLKKGVHPLGDAFQLDDAPRFERFVFVADDQPVDIDAVMKAAEAAADSSDPRKSKLGLPDDLDQVSFVLRKGEQ